MLSYRQHMERAAQRYLSSLLQRTSGNVTKAARRAKYNRTTFYELLRRHGISVPSPGRTTRERGV